MADFEAIIKKHVVEGAIPAEAIGDIVKGINNAVGNEFVAKDRYKAKLTEIDELKGKLQDAEDSVTTAEKWKSKFEESEKAFTDYKASQEAEVVRSKKQKAYKALLKEVGVSEKFRERAMKGISFDDMEIDDDGKFKEAEKITAAIKKDWGDCIVSEDTKGANVATPPGNVSSSVKTPSRAAEIVAKYHNEQYGKKED